MVDERDEASRERKEEEMDERRARPCTLDDEQRNVALVGSPVSLPRAKLQRDRTATDQAKSIRSVELMVVRSQPLSPGPSLPRRPRPSGAQRPVISSSARAHSQIPVVFSLSPILVSCSQPSSAALSACRPTTCLPFPLRRRTRPRPRWLSLRSCERRTSPRRSRRRSRRSQQRRSQTRAQSQVSTQSECAAQACSRAWIGSNAGGHRRGRRWEGGRG